MLAVSLIQIDNLQIIVHFMWIFQICSVFSYGLGALSLNAVQCPLFVRHSYLVSVNVLYSGLFLWVVALVVLVALILVSINITHCTCYSSLDRSLLLWVNLAVVETIAAVVWQPKAHF